MADPMKTTECLKKLGFSELDAQWVDAVWEQDFTEKPELPPGLARDVTDTRTYARRLQQAVESCVPWARIDFATLPQGFWSVLSESGLSPRALLALLHHFMCAVDKVLSTATQRELAVLSANLYFVLNEIPGSGAYKIFHPLVFQEAVDLLKQWPDPASAKRKRNASGPTSTQVPQAGRRASKSRRVDGRNGAAAADGGGVDRTTPFDSDDDEDDDNDELTVLTPQEIGRIKAAVLGALRNFVQLLRNSTLKDAEQSTQHAMQVLSDLTRVTGDQNEINEFDSTASPNSSACVSHIAYLGLAALCSSSHGAVTDMFTLVLKHLMPNLLMLIGDNEAVAMATIPKTIQIIKDNAIAFIHRMTFDLEDKAVPSLRLLLQHLCVKVPDKAEYRAKTARTVARVLTRLSVGHRAKFIEWLYKYSRNVKIGHRVFALEVVAVLLEQLPTAEARQTPSGPAAAPAGDVDQQYLSPTFLTQLLLSRCSDRAPTVRAKALICFAEFTTSTDPTIQKALTELFYPSGSPTTPAPILQLGDTDQVTDGEQRTRDGATPGNLMGGSPALLLEMSNGSPTDTVGQNIIAMLKKRACDEKVGVRKAALQALENVLRLPGGTVTAKELRVLHDACLDPALSVRKQAVVSLTTLLMEEKTCAPLQKVWLQSILPGVVDREVSAQEKCLQLLKEVLLDGITARSHGDSDASRLSWDLLGVLSQNDAGELRRYLPKACQLWSKQKLLSASLVRAVLSHINHDNDQAAWLLLAEVAPCAPTFDPAVVRQAWDRRKPAARADDDDDDDRAAAAGPDDPATLQRVLAVMGSLAGRFPDAARREMIGELRERLLAFDAPPELSRALVAALHKLCLAVDGGGPDRTSRLLEGVAEEVLRACSAHLSRLILEECPAASNSPSSGQPAAAVSEDALVRYLATLGEVACLCPAKTSRRVIMLVQSLLAGPTRFELVGDSIPGSQPSQSQSQSQPPPLSQFGNSAAVLSDTVRAHVFIALGKLCLLHESLAKQCVAALSRELETSANPAVRNNVAVIMCDLCIRYPNVVDRYISNLSMCFRDESQLVRKQSLTLLTHLLLEDYIKWRGPLFFHFVTSLVDDVKEIRDFADFTLVQLLLKRHPNMLHQHFVESVFHFNAYDKHAVYNQFSQTERERALFALKGAPNAGKRRTIYRFMLQRMTDEHRFKLTAKLCQEVLAAIVDGVLPLDEETNVLLQDTLEILCCKEIKLTSLRPKSTSDLDDQLEMAEAVINQAKTKIITQVVKRNVIENIVPVVIALKHALEKARSPTLRHLMLYLKQLMKDYRNEVKDILAADRQLATEIEFDLRRFEEEQAEAARRQKQAASASLATSRPGSRPATPGSKPATPRMQRATPLSSPQQGAGLPAVLSPRAVANCSPRIIRNPRAGVVNAPDAAPEAAPGATGDGVPAGGEEPIIDGGGPATPVRANRPISLAAQAIVNSARRAIASARRCPPTASANRPPPDDASPSRVVVKTEKRSPLKERNQPVAFDKTPPRRGLRGRAISTPDQTIANITFQAPMDLSLIPASPSLVIPSSLPIRVYSDIDPKKVVGTASWTPQLQVENKKDLLLMLSPDQPTPKPRTWNITSPTQGPRRARARTSSAPGGEETAPPVGKRRTRASTSSAAASVLEEEVGGRNARPRRSSRSKQK